MSSTPNELVKAEGNFEPEDIEHDHDPQNNREQDSDSEGSFENEYDLKGDKEYESIPQNNTEFNFQNPEFQSPVVDDYTRLTREEAQTYLRFLLNQLDFFIRETNNNYGMNTISSKYIQNFEFQEQNFGSLASMEFVSPVGALIQKPIDLSCFFWNVQVVNAVSPANFWVRSYKLLGILDKTTTELNKFYDGYHPKNCELSFDDLQLGGFYVVKTDLEGENLWARCKIVEPFTKNMPVMALLVDSGILVNSAPGNFRFLTVSFSALPVQAYEASLGTGYPEPASRLLTPEICLRFRSRVNGIGFPSVLRGLTFDSGDFKHIKLFLVDTSTEPDKWIHQEFL